jgi:hypothetical protein
MAFSQMDSCPSHEIIPQGLQTVLHLDIKIIIIVLEYKTILLLIVAGIIAGVGLDRRLLDRACLYPRMIVPDNVWVDY